MKAREKERGSRVGVFPLVSWRVKNGDDDPVRVKKKIMRTRTKGNLARLSFYLHGLPIFEPAREIEDGNSLQRQ